MTEAIQPPDDDPTLPNEPSGPFRLLDEAEAAEVAGMFSELRADGYQMVGAHGGLMAGARVQHVSERFPTPNGTATVLAVFHRPGSAWERLNSRPDVEVVVVKDDPTLEGFSRIAQWADYTCQEVAEPYCNHDAPAVVDGVCECGKRVE